MADTFLNKSGLQRVWNRITTLLAGKADSGHTHTKSQITDFPAIPAAVAVKGNAESSYRTGNVNLTPANLGLGNVGNFKAVSTVASQGLTSTEKSNARANIGAGTSSFSGSYNDLSNKPSIPAEVTESTVSGWGFTKNTGTYSKPSGGIPKTDLASAVQTSLGKADSALQSHQDISGKQDKITAITAQSTQAVYPIKIDSQGHIVAYGSAVTIPAAVAVKGDSESSYRTGNVNITKANIGLGNVGNFKAVSTAASQGLSDTEKSNARTNIGAGTSSFSGSYNDLSNKPTIPAAVAVKGNSESSYRTGNVNLTVANIGAAASSHTHGNIQNGGTLQTNDVAIASGDKLVVTDASDSNKVARTSVSFDGSTTTQFLSKKGTFETPTVSVTIDENTVFNISGTTFKIELVS